MEHGNKICSTTIVCVRKGTDVAMAGDGQVTLGHQIIKNSAQKLRKLGNGKVIAGFAGVAADGFALFEKLDDKLQGVHELERLVVELAREWRSDKFLRRYEAMLIVADRDNTFILSGNGDVLRPENLMEHTEETSICAIGSGGTYALSAGQALLQYTDFSSEDIARKALEIAASICIFTNNHISLINLKED